MDTKKTINGVTYMVTPFGALEALKIEVALAKQFGAAFGDVFKALDGASLKTATADISTVNVNFTALSDAIRTLVSTLDEAVFIELAFRLLKGVVAELPNAREGKTLVSIDSEASYNLVFAGKINDVFAVIAFVLGVNYGDFFGRMLQGIGKLGTPISGGTTNGSDTSLKS